ncbi:hypothetical protein BaRGS_00009349, partial [Batillaria attramentaria]
DVCTPEGFPDDVITQSWSSSADGVADSPVWCPETSDTEPYLEFRFVDSAQGQWAVKSVNLTATADFDGYALNYDLYGLYPDADSNSSWTLLAQDASAVQPKPEGGKFYYTQIFRPPFVVQAVRLYPNGSFDGSGQRCLNVTLYGCPTTDLCTSPCQNGGMCVGVNLCSCPEGFFGADCSFSAQMLLQLIFRLRLTILANTQLQSDVGAWQVTLSSGFRIQEDVITIRGSRVFLYSTALTNSFQCLMQPSSFSAFYVSFSFRLGAFGSGDITGLFGTDATQDTEGVNAWIVRGDSEYSLVVEVRRLNLKWTVVSTPAAIQTVGSWVRLEISWDVAKGLAVYVDDEVVGRVRSGQDISSMTSAQYFIIGYPSFDYTLDYDVDLEIGEFSVSPATRRQTLISVAETCPVNCENRGWCVNDFTCGCPIGFFGPGCFYTAQTDTELSTSMGTLQKGSVTGVSFTTNSITLTGTGVYLFTDSPLDLFGDLVSVSEVSSFTLAFSFSVFDFTSPAYIMCTDYFGGETQGVNVVLEADLTLVVHLNLRNTHWEASFRFEDDEVLRTGVLLEISLDRDADRLRLYVNGALVAEGEEESSSVERTSAGVLVFGLPKSDYNESVTCGMTIYQLTMWRAVRSTIVSEVVYGLRQCPSWEEIWLIASEPCRESIVAGAQESNLDTACSHYEASLQCGVYVMRARGYDCTPDILLQSLQTATDASLFTGGTNGFSLPTACTAVTGSFSQELDTTPVCAVRDAVRYVMGYVCRSQDALPDVSSFPSNPCTTLLSVAGCVADALGSLGPHCSYQDMFASVAAEVSVSSDFSELTEDANKCNEFLQKLTSGDPCFNQSSVNCFSRLTIFFQAAPSSINGACNALDSTSTCLARESQGQCTAQDSRKSIIDWMSYFYTYYVVGSTVMVPNINLENQCPSWQEVWIAAADTCRASIVAALGESDLDTACLHYQSVLKCGVFAMRAKGYNCTPDEILQQAATDTFLLTGQLSGFSLPSSCPAVNANFSQDLDITPLCEVQDSVQYIMSYICRPDQDSLPDLSGFPSNPCTSALAIAGCVKAAFSSLGQSCSYDELYDQVIVGSFDFSLFPSVTAAVGSCRDYRLKLVDDPCFNQTDGTCTAQVTNLFQGTPSSLRESCTYVSS